MRTNGLQQYNQLEKQIVLIQCTDIHGFASSLESNVLTAETRDVVEVAISKAYHRRPYNAHSSAQTRCQQSHKKHKLIAQKLLPDKQI